MNGQSGGVYLFGSLDGFWRCTGSGLHVLFIAISCYLAERDLDTIHSKSLAWQLHFWVVNEFLFLKTVNANFTFPEILYKLLGTNLFPQKNFTKSYKESSGLIACGNWQVKQSIGHFRVPKTLSLKTRLSANPFLWKWVLFPWKLKLVFTSMVFYLATIWNRGTGELGNGLSLSLTRSCDLSCAASRKFCSSSTNCWGTVPIRPSSWACESFWASFSGRPRKRWRSTTWATYQNNKQ